MTSKQKALATIFIFPALFLVLISGSTGAQSLSPETGNTLLEHCESGDKQDGDLQINAMKAGLCFGYIEGAADILAFDAAAFPNRRLECTPKEVTRGQERDVVVKYLRDHPEERHESAALLVLHALTTAFPCKPR